MFSSPPKLTKSSRPGISFFFNSAYLENGFSGISLDILSVNDDLNDPVPDLFGDVVAGQPDQVQDDVHVPLVIRGILLGQNRNFQNLSKKRISHDEFDQVMHIMHNLSTCIKVLIQRSGL